VSSTQLSSPVRPIPFFDGARSFEATWPDVLELLHELMNRGKYSHGMMVERLEKAIASYTGARHAFGVNSGTDALTLLMRSAGIGPGAEVIVPCFTFVASASSVVHTGAWPVFVDIEPSSYAMAPEAVAAAITENTRAIMPVHLFCQMADMEPILDLAREKGLLVIEDSAEAIGMRWGGVHAGLLGLGGVLSFFPTKTLGALGDGGMVLTNDDHVAELVRVMRHHGRTGRTIDNLPGISHEAVVCGTNSKMDDIQAAVLLVRLTRLERDIARRAELARAYDERLAHLAPQVRSPRRAPRATPTNAVYYTYVIEAERKAELVKFLAGRSIGTEEYYPSPLHLQPCFRYLGHKEGSFPVAERACKRTIALPLYPDLGLDDVDRVAGALEDFYLRGATR
jgi:UDP-2-acetamido-2-deoxy-ribo-hexuluronate aminotransferase